MESNKKRIIIFCVNYNSYDKTMQYLNSIEEAASQSDIEVSVIIADNSNPVKEIETDFSNLLVKHIVTNGNLGYLGAVKYAIRDSKINMEAYDYSVISNVDVLLDRNFFVHLSKMECREDLGCIAPSIYSYRKQRDINPRMINRISKKQIRLLQVMYSIPLLYWINSKVVSPIRHKSQEHINRRNIYAPHGSFMLFTKKFAPFLQTFTYPAFLYGEEIFFAENLRRNGLTVIYEPVLTIYDFENDSTGKLASKTRLKWCKEAMTILYQNYFKE